MELFPEEDYGLSAVRSEFHEEFFVVALDFLKHIHNFLFLDNPGL